MNEELYHYGVLGMKWGVRKDPKRAMKKASAKLHKLDNTAQKHQKRYVRRTHGWGLKSLRSYSEKKANSSSYKAYKWYRSMEREFRKTNVVDISEKDKAMGKYYLDRFKVRQ